MALVLAECVAMVTCIAIDYSSLPTCYHGNIAMQMAVDYVGLPTGAHTYMHKQKHVQTTFYPLRTLDLRYIPCIGYLICD